MRVVGLRLLQAVATALAAAGLLFALLLAAPGDPSDLVGDDRARDALAAEWGYDRPAAARLGGWLGGVARGDLGESRAVRPGAPVAELLGGRAAVSARVLAGAVGAVALVAVGLAFATAGRARSPLRAAVQLASSPPAFLLAYGVVTAVNAATWALLQRGAIGRPAWFALPDQDTPARTALAVTVVALGSGTLAQVHGELEDALVRLRAAPWVDAALGRGEAVGGLVLRGLVPTLASALADRTAPLLGSLVVVEKVLLLPGAGALLFDAAAVRDYDVALAAALGAAAVGIGARLAADLVRMAVDPRLRAFA